MKELVEMAAERQIHRFRGETFRFNSEIPSGKVHDYCRMTARAERLLERAYEMLGLTARSYHRLLKTARTIADLNGSEQIEEEHLSEAMAYRKEDT